LSCSRYDEIALWPPRKIAVSLKYAYQFSVLLFFSLSLIYWRLSMTIFVWFFCVLSWHLKPQFITCIMQIVFMSTLFSVCSKFCFYKQSKHCSFKCTFSAEYFLSWAQIAEWLVALLYCAFFVFVFKIISCCKVWDLTVFV